MHYETRVRQNEIAERTLHAHHAVELRATAGGRVRRSVASRVDKTIFALGVCSP